jgi:hypothetical protein
VAPLDVQRAGDGLQVEGAVVPAQEREELITPSASGGDGRAGESGSGTWGLGLWSCRGRRSRRRLLVPIDACEELGQVHDIEAVT